MKKILSSVMTLLVALATVSCGGNATEEGRKAQELSGAGATFPYGLDENDKNIRIAPTYPSMEDLAKALELFVISVKLASAEKLLSEME